MFDQTWPVSRVLRYSAFTAHGRGGNPAGVLLDASGLDDAQMLAIAADVGYSESVFLTEPGIDDGRHTYQARYFSPIAEVAFCGHATIAAAGALAERYGPGAFGFRTVVGTVPVRTSMTDEGPVATLTSVAPATTPVAAEDLVEALATLGWSPEDLDPALPARVAYAGAQHLVLAAVSAARLAALEYDMQRLALLMSARGWTTVALVHRTGPDELIARNPFPVGGVFEDPATGAAAAALGGYLRELGLVHTPARVTVRQGEQMGRPSLLLVDIPAGSGGIDVTGAATRMG